MAPALPHRWRAGAAAYRQVAGFTLLELLVVIVILGILYTVMTLSVGVIGSTDRDLEREAQQLQALLQSALQDAVLEGREFGLRLSPGAYEFALMDPDTGEWLPLTASPIYAPRQLDPQYRLALELEGRRVDLEGGDRRRERDEWIPQIFILSSDEVSPFRIELEHRGSNRRIRIASTAASRIELERDD